MMRISSLSIVARFGAPFLCVLLSAAPPTAFAFTPPKDVAGPLTVEIADPGKIAQLEKPVPVPVTLRNSGAAPVKGLVRIEVIDQWRVQGETEKAFDLPAGGSQQIPFEVIPGHGTYAALYPVHARATFKDADGKEQTAHPILIVSVSEQALAAEPSKSGDLPLLTAPRRGPMRFDGSTSARPIIAVNGKEPVTQAVGWKGSDPETGASFSPSEADRGDKRRAFNMHPPFRNGWGEILLDYRVALPGEGPIIFETATAIRDHDAKREGASDGVEFKVQALVDGEFRTLFERFSAAKIWEPVRVDLTPFAGRETVLRLWTGPGPKHNTSCDSAYWAEPLLWVGVPPAPETPAQRAARRKAALASATAALHDGSGEWRWKLGDKADPIGAAIAPGPNGIADAFLAFVSGERCLVIDGFRVELGGVPLGAGKAGHLCERVESKFTKGRGLLRHHILLSDRPVVSEAQVWVEKGTLRIKFAMPGVERDKRGEPRYTLLHPGPMSEKARRVYAGFGNVLHEPGAFDLRAGGFTLSTRHVGAEFPNGIALVQATDIFPDYYRNDPTTGLCALATHHDATFSFVPSTRGAFAAARLYRATAGFRPAGGVAGMLGRMCLDQWGGDYREAAAEIEKAARYGLTDAVFVKHSWQRWGYDYRLPDIWPPAGNLDDFLAMGAACKKHGILFAPHDNYIDFYPDADGYSYEHIIFNPDGRPQKAWLNEGREAQSYRWSPTAFFPWLERNLKIVKKGAAPTGYFIDVFTAMPPIDFYDRDGRFHPKTVTAERWGAAFDLVRKTFGNNAPTISEAGHDALIGHLDAGQADHNRWDPSQARWAWGMPAADGERVPWHDIVSHGSFVLLAGGLGHRYAGEDNDQFLHGYASDDYLGMTLLGGRNPMCDGPFSRRAVMTYWLLHDVCHELARRDMLSHEFVGEDIHRQISRFAGEAFARVNRGLVDWQIEGDLLPPFGFAAQAGDRRAEVARREGVITGFSASPGRLFADARPPLDESPATAEPRVTSIEDLGGGKVRLKMEIEILEPAPKGSRAFLHFDDASQRRESIAFQGNIRIDEAKLGLVGNHAAVAEAAAPPDAKLPARVEVRCGLYLPGQGGRRLQMAGPVDRGGRARCGQLVFEGRKPEEIKVRWEPEPKPATADIRRQERLNLDRREIDFGPAITNGAFRLEYDRPEWMLTPLPSSPSFRVSLRCERLGRKEGRVTEIVPIDLDGKPRGATTFKQEAGLLRFETAESDFAYRIRFAQ